MSPSTSIVTAVGALAVTLALIGVVCYLAAAKVVTGAQAMTFLTLIATGAGVGGVAVVSHNAGARSATRGLDSTTKGD